MMLLLLLLVQLLTRESGRQAMDALSFMVSMLVHVVVVVFLLFYLPISWVWRLVRYVFVRPFILEDMRGKVVLITGASSGVGEQLAYQYAKRGALLCLTARREQALKTVAKNARVQGSPDVMVIPADVSNENASKKVIEEAVAHFGKLDHLVANAGILSSSLFEEITNISAFTQVMDVNFWGAVYPTFFAIPHLKRSRGKIAVMSSIAGRAPPARMGFYNASKAALIRFYETLRAEVGPDIKITILTPGWVSSELTNGKALQKGGEMQVNEEVRDAQIGFFPVANTDKCAEAIVDSICRGDEYLTWPSWYNILHVLMCVAPELVNWFTRSVYVTKPGDTPNQVLSKRILEATGAKKFLYPSSIRSSETKQET